MMICLAFVLTVILFALVLRRLEKTKKEKRFAEHIRRGALVGDVFHRLTERKRRLYRFGERG